MREKPPTFEGRERYIRDRETGELRSEGEMRESAQKMMEAGRKKGGLQNPSRRAFLAATGEALTGAAVGGVAYGLWKASNETERQDDASPAEDEQEKEIEYEKEPELLMPHEQLARGEAVDLNAGIEAVFAEHREHLLDPERSGADMEQAAENIQALDIQHFVRPFLERGLPHKLAYMIAIQETRGRTKTSWAGAAGVTGIMPSTAEHHGYDPEDVRDPYIASEITAKYLANERDQRFGKNNTDMLLHAYNGGGGLFGFTASVSREERTPENFYQYMEERINETAAEKRSVGYHVHEFDRRTENLIDVSELFDVPLEAIERANPDLDPTAMQYGDEIKIPLTDATPTTWRQVFRKEFETLYYTPELKAKYAALKARGLVSKIEEPLDTRLASAD